MLNKRHINSENSFVEMVLASSSSRHGQWASFQISTCPGSGGSLRLRYDHEQGKGDHRHVQGEEHPYIFTTPRALLNDFWNDVDNWRF